MTFVGRKSENIQVIPKAVAAKQDVKTLLKDGVKGGVEELVDNSIGAVLSEELRAQIARSSKGKTAYVPR
jgi:hypothetical protein